jgi:hypothetical protein
MGGHPPPIVSEIPVDPPRGFRGRSTGSCTGPPVALIERAGPSGQGHPGGPYHRKRLQRAPFGPKGREVEPSEGKRQVGSADRGEIARPLCARGGGRALANGSPAKLAGGLRLRSTRLVADLVLEGRGRAALNFAKALPPPRAAVLGCSTRDSGSNSPRVRTADSPFEKRGRTTPPGAELRVRREKRDA